MRGPIVAGSGAERIQDFRADGSFRTPARAVGGIVLFLVAGSEIGDVALGRVGDKGFSASVGSGVSAMRAMVLSGMGYNQAEIGGVGAGQCFPSPWGEAG